MNNSPPKWPDRFLKWYCKPDLIEDLQGDLYELHETKCANGNIKSANYFFIWHVLKSFRYATINKNLIPKLSVLTMTTNNFKIAFRVHKRDKFNTGINLLGLTIGIACFMLLGLYFIQETSYDQFHSKKDRIYRTWLKEDYGDGKLFFSSTTPLRFESLLEENFPEVQTAVQFMSRRFLVGSGKNRINERVSVISPEFYKVFDFKLIGGNITNPLGSRNDLILSKSYATKYFGSIDPVGKTLAIQLGENVRLFTITAIMEDIPKASSIQFQMAISNENNLELFGEESLSAWFNIIPETYVLLKKNVSSKSIDDNMQKVIMSYLSEEVNEGEYNIGLQPITDIHMNPEIPEGYAAVANPQYIYILGIIGLLVLVIACINYTTLTVGQSIKRTKEVGMRKVLGALKPMLIYQYMSESILVTMLAMAFGGVITFFLIPVFNNLTGTEVIYIFEYWHLGILLGIAIVIGILAGSYPALVMSNFNINKALKGKASSVNNNLLR